MPVTADEPRLTTAEVHEKVLVEAHMIFAQILAECGPEIALAIAELVELVAWSETGFGVELYGGRLRITTPTWSPGLPF